VSSSYILVTVGKLFARRDARALDEIPGHERTTSSCSLGIL